MAVKHIIAAGIGFSPGGVGYIVTRGFGSAEVSGVEPVGIPVAKGRLATVNAAKGRTTAAGRSNRWRLR